jgi:hypothetical protein
MQVKRMISAMAKQVALSSPTGLGCLFADNECKATHFIHLKEPIDNLNPQRSGLA